MAREGVSRALRAWLVLLVVAGAAHVVAGAAAEDVTREELRRLAERAQARGEALAELERVDSVDGRPVDVRAALAGAEPDELAERLDTLAESVDSAGGVEAARARGEARDVLAERRFRETDLPRPFRGILVAIADRLRDAFAWLARHLPGGDATVWSLLAASVVLLAALLAARLGRRRVGLRAARERAAAEEPSADPRRLEREADDAERRGELERALRLRFRAGLLRLDRARAIDLRDSATTGELRRRLGSREFDRLAETFDEVVYGRRPPRVHDVERSRQGWARVLEEAGA